MIVVVCHVRELSVMVCVAIANIAESLRFGPRSQMPEVFHQDMKECFGLLINALCPHFSITRVSEKRKLSLCR